MIEQTSETPATAATVRGHGRSAKEIDVADRICSIQDCNSPREARSLCQKHYTRLLRTGTTDPGPMAHGTPEERFWRHVQKSDGCWLWTGHVNNNGYGTFTKNTTRGAARRHVYAHRFSYELHNGPIAENAHVLHICDNPPCVNPAHLRIGTALDNIRDAATKDRIAHGDHHPHAKLTAEQVREILALKATGGPTCREIAKRYGVSECTISDIIRGITWVRVSRAFHKSTKEGA